MYKNLILTGCEHHYGKWSRC